AMEQPIGFISRRRAPEHFCRLLHLLLLELQVVGVEGPSLLVNCPSSPTKTIGWFGTRPGTRARASQRRSGGRTPCRCRPGGTFLRRVSVAGTVTVLHQAFRVGKKQKGLYLRLVVDTGRGKLTAYLKGRVLQRWPYQLWNDSPTPRHAAAVG